jgi:hypothetical protein
MHDQEGIFECTCMLTELNDEFAIADIILKRDGKVWCAITGWQNRRLEIDAALWNVSMSPLHNRLSEEIAPEVFFFHQAYTRVASWDFILKRYFNQTEKQHHQQLLPNKKKNWMVSRVAVKDAVRNLLRKEKIMPASRSPLRSVPMKWGNLTSSVILQKTFIFHWLTKEKKQWVSRDTENL